MGVHAVDSGRVSRGGDAHNLNLWCVEREHLLLPLVEGIMGERPPCRPALFRGARLLLEEGGGAPGTHTFSASHSLGFFRADGVDSVKLLKAQEDGSEGRDPIAIGSLNPPPPPTLT